MSGGDGAKYPLLCLQHGDMPSNLSQLRANAPGSAGPCPRIHELSAEPHASRGMLLRLDIICHEFIHER